MKKILSLFLPLFLSISTFAAEEITDQSLYQRFLKFQYTGVVDEIPIKYDIQNPAYDVALQKIRAHKELDSYDLDALLEVHLAKQAFIADSLGITAKKLSQLENSFHLAIAIHFQSKAGKMPALNEREHFYQCMSDIDMEVAEKHDACEQFEKELKLDIARILQLPMDDAWFFFNELTAYESAIEVNHGVEPLPNTLSTFVNNQSETEVVEVYCDEKCQSALDGHQHSLETIVTINGRATLFNLTNLQKLTVRFNDKNGNSIALERWRYRPTSPSYFVSSIPCTSCTPQHTPK